MKWGTNTKEDLCGRFLLEMFSTRLPWKTQRGQNCPFKILQYEFQCKYWRVRQLWDELHPLKVQLTYFVNSFQAKKHNPKQLLLSARCIWRNLNPVPMEEVLCNINLIIPWIILWLACTSRPMSFFTTEKLAPGKRKCVRQPVQQMWKLASVN